MQRFLIALVLLMILVLVAFCPMTTFGADSRKAGVVTFKDTTATDRMDKVDAYIDVQAAKGAYADAVAEYLMAVDQKAAKAVTDAAKAKADAAKAARDTAKAAEAAAKSDKDAKKPK